MAKFRLAVFNTQPPHLYFGGVERRIIETTKRLQNEADINVYSGTKAGFTQPAALDGVKVIPIKSTDKIFPLDNWFFNRNLTKKANTLEADVYEAHAVSGYGFPKALKKLGVNKPFIHTIHGVLADEYEQAKISGYTSTRNKIANYFMHRLAKLEEETAKNASLIVTISDYSLQKIRQHYKVDTSKVRIVPNGVDIEKFKVTTEKDAAKRKLGFSTEPCVLFVGSLIPRKGVGYLVEAAKKVVKECADAKFMIVGDGPLKSQLQKEIDTAGLLKNFVFMGNVTDEQLLEIYGCADVFALPSVQEGQGIVLLEAQAAGLPVVAFNIGGVNEAVRSGETGFLVETGNVDQFGDALRKLISDAELRVKMGNNGNQWVVSRFSWEKCANNMLHVYREALNFT